ncbi:MAG: hypothetical protein JXA93_22520, partial [Anaerolineae bacterium]|nr:hypothetical protein [Anaerolineae bacterium]
MSPSSLKRLVPLCGVVVLVVCALVALPGGELLARDLAATVARSAPYWIDGGHPNTLGGRQASASQVFEPSRLTLAGALTYEDMKTMEEEARGLLRSNRQFRESISPHDEQVDFDTLVRQFDYDVGFSQDIPGGMTLQERLDQADRELRRARDLYAILAV